jgi:hypothetical protein
MKPDYSIVAQLLAGYVGYKGLPFPAGRSLKSMQGKTAQEEYGEAPLNMADRKYTRKGVPIYKEGRPGRWYFMPVTFIDGEKQYEISDAVINITGKKTVIETPMAGRKGSVKELISIDDYKISIAGYVSSTDGSYPEDAVMAIRELFNINRSLQLESALTSLIFDEGDRVVITDIAFPETPGVESGQVIKIECVTDREFELISG